MPPLAPAVADNRSVLFKWASILLLTGLFGGLFIANLRRVEHGKRGDFPHFWHAAKAMADGNDPYRAWHEGYIYPPLVAWLYRPLANLPERRAAEWALALNLLIAVAGLWATAEAFTLRLGVARTAGTVLGVMALAALFNTDKIKIELQMWQTNVVMLLMFALALRWLDRRPAWAGAALGLAMNIKFMTLPMLPYLAIRRRWRALGGFAAWSVLIALLPSLEIGFGRNLHYWREELGGLLGLMGMPLTGGGPRSSIEPIGAIFSISITSALARVRLGFPPVWSLAPLAMALFAGVIAGVYRLKGVPLLRWPAADRQRHRPWRGIVALEWTGLVTAVLAFSPQTNTAHLFCALLITAPAAVMLMGRRATTGGKAALLVSMLVMAGCMSFPPGHITDDAAARLALRWKHGGGPSWGILQGYLVVLWVGLDCVRDRPRAGARSRREEGGDPLPALTEPGSSATGGASGAW